MKSKTKQIKNIDEDLRKIYNDHMREIGQPEKYIKRGRRRTIVSNDVYDKIIRMKNG